MNDKDSKLAETDTRRAMLDLTGIALKNLVINFSFSEEEDKLLMLLSRRISPDNNDWYRQSGSKYLNIFRCLICNDTTYGGAAMVEHAKGHLKESNLMVFI